MIASLILFSKGSRSTIIESAAGGSTIFSEGNSRAFGQMPPDLSRGWMGAGQRIDVAQRPRVLNKIAILTNHTQETILDSSTQKITGQVIDPDLVLGREICRKSISDFLKFIETKEVGRAAFGIYIYMDMLIAKNKKNDC
jgi:hypothetical protein